MKENTVIRVLAVLLIALSIYLLFATPLVYGKMALVGSFIFLGISFLFQKRKFFRRIVLALLLAGNTFIIFSGLHFVITTAHKRDLFDIETAVYFEKSSFDVTLKHAKNEQKYVFVDFYTAWCAPCLGFTRNVLTDNQVGEEMNKYFVNLKYDAEKGEGVEIAKRYNVRSYPTLLILNSEGEVIEDIYKSVNRVPSKQDMLDVITRYSNH